MKKWLILMLAALMLAAMPAALADETKITVQGSAEISTEPDMFTITSNVAITRDTVIAAQEEVAAVIENATTKLIELGALKEDIVTENFSYYPQYDYSSTGENRLIGYQVNHTLRVTCRDLEMLDSVISVLTDCGMTETYNVSFDISTRSELYRQALTLAIDAAKVKADAMAAAGGLKITQIESMEERTSGVAVRYANTEDKALMAGTVSSGIRSGDVSVSASVTVVYEAE